VHYRFANYELDTEGAILYHAGQPIALQRRVLAVLTYLIVHQGRVVSKDELADKVWQGAIDNTTIESCIKKVRRAVGDTGREQQVIVTRFGLGYVFVAPVVSLVAAAQVAYEPATLPTPPANPSLPSISVPDALLARTGDLTRLRGLARMHRQTALPLVGRSQELAWCGQVLAEAQAGMPGLVLVEGETGIGKTRLLTEVRTLAVQRGFQVYSGRCHEDLALPYLPFVRSVLADMVQAPATLQHHIHAEMELVRRFLRPDEAPMVAPILPWGSRISRRSRSTTPWKVGITPWPQPAGVAISNGRVPFWRVSPSVSCSLGVWKRRRLSRRKRMRSRVKSPTGVMGCRWLCHC
jgi:DNA-binding winged helix-turn-helix (wHTH) protein